MMMKKKKTTDPAKAAHDEAEKDILKDPELSDNDPTDPKPADVHDACCYRHLFSPHSVTSADVYDACCHGHPAPPGTIAPDDAGRVALSIRLGLVCLDAAGGRPLLGRRPRELLSAEHLGEQCQMAGKLYVRCRRHPSDDFSRCREPQAS